MADKKRNIDREQDMPNKKRQDDEHIKREDDTSKKDKNKEEGNWEEEKNR